MDESTKNSDVYALLNEAFAVLSEAGYWVDRYNEITDELQRLGYPQFGPISAYMCNTYGGCTCIAKSSDVFDLFELNRQTSPQIWLGAEMAALKFDRHGKVVGTVSIPKKDTIREKRQSIGASAGWKCAYCQEPGTTETGPDGRSWHVDHIYPKSLGGDNEADNLILSCATCNLKKFAATGLEMILKLREKMSACTCQKTTPKSS